MKKKYQIFISSTYVDLKEERQVVCNAILKIHQFPVGMEQFNAGDSKQWEVIKEAIDSSDYYVLILGKRYGSTISSGDEAGISYTEKEYNYAVSRGVPVLAFIKSDDASFRGDAFEDDTKKKKKLNFFKEKVKANHIVERFSNSYELASEVTAALHNEMGKNVRPGWVRGNQSEIEDKIDELIRTIKYEFGYDDDIVKDYDDWCEPVTKYEFISPRFPADGEHKEIGRNGAPIGEGEYKKGKLVKGVEYDVLIHVTEGSLTYMPDCPENPYDSSDDFSYDRLESYGWGLSFKTFGTSENYIVNDGLDPYYVVDFDVDEKMERMKNIRTLCEFLEEKDPDQLETLLELIEIENGDTEKNTASALSNPIHYHCSTPIPVRH